jgi:hypothetical protein
MCAAQFGPTAFKAVRVSMVNAGLARSTINGRMADQDYFFGSAPGETGAGFTPGVVAADAADLQSIAINRTPLGEFGTELITEPPDVNRDRTINAFDLQVGKSLRLVAKSPAAADGLTSGRAVGPVTQDPHTASYDSSRQFRVASDSSAFAFLSAACAAANSASRKLRGERLIVHSATTAPIP